MAIGHITLCINALIQQELTSLPNDAFVDDYWTHLSFCYSIAIPSTVYKDFKEALNIHLNPGQRLS